MPAETGNRDPGPPDFAGDHFISKVIEAPAANFAGFERRVFVEVPRAGIPRVDGASDPAHDEASSPGSPKRSGTTVVPRRN
jgi:hypothetical protein